MANDLISIIHKHECCVHDVLVLNLVELKIQRSVRAKFSVVCCIYFKDSTYGLGSPSQDCQRFVDDFAMIFSSDWSNRLSNF